MSEKCSHEMVLLIFRAKHIETKHRIPSVQETLCSIPSLHRADKIVHLNSRHAQGKVRVEKCSHEMVILNFRAKHIERRRNTAHNSHHCLRLRENATKHRTQFSPLSSTPRKYHKSHQKRQIDIQTPRKCHETPHTILTTVFDSEKIPQITSETTN